jgi:hypothetical protein
MEALGYAMIGLGCLSIVFVIIGTVIAHVRGYHDPERQQAGIEIQQNGNVE